MTQRKKTISIAGRCESCLTKIFINENENDETSIAFAPSLKNTDRFTVSKIPLKSYDCSNLLGFSKFRWWDFAKTLRIKAQIKDYV